MQGVEDIVIVGGGFAATTLARRLEKRLPQNQAVTVVSEQPVMTYTPLLAEVVGASLPPTHAVAPLRRLLGRSRFLRARVTAVDPHARSLTLQAGCRRELHYGQLVLACGLAADLDLLPGAREHALPLKTVGDALHLRNQLLARLEDAALEPDPEARRALLSFVVIGGGDSGVEVAGAIADLLADAGRYFPPLEVRPSILLLETGERLLPALPPRLGEAARRQLERRGVEVRLGAAARRIGAEAVELEDGTRLCCRTVITTVGLAPGPLLRSLDLPKRKGLLLTDPDMRVQGRDDIWAIGDCALNPNRAEQGTAPPSAQYAVREARQLADNLRRALRGEPTRAFAHRSLGQMTTVGRRRAVARVLGLGVTGFPAWLLWRAYYLAAMPSLLRRAQVFLEWNLDLLFPPDLTALVLERSGGETPADASAEAAPEGPERSRRAAAG